MVPTFELQAGDQCSALRQAQKEARCCSADDRVTGDVAAGLYRDIRHAARRRGRLQRHPRAHPARRHAARAAAGHPRRDDEAHDGHGARRRRSARLHRGGLLGRDAARVSPDRQRRRGVGLC